MLTCTECSKFKDTCAAAEDQKTKFRKAWKNSHMPKVEEEKKWFRFHIFNNSVVSLRPYNSDRLPEFDLLAKGDDTQHSW